MTFEDWYNSYTWWKDQREEWEQIWDALPDDQAVTILDRVVELMSAEYGE